MQLLVLYSKSKAPLVVGICLIGCDLNMVSRLRGVRLAVPYVVGDFRFFGGGRYSTLILGSKPILIK